MSKSKKKQDPDLKKIEKDLKEVTKAAVEQAEKQFPFKDRSDYKNSKLTQEQLEIVQSNFRNNGMRFAEWIGENSFERIGVFVESCLDTGAMELYERTVVGEHIPNHGLRPVVLTNRADQAAFVQAYLEAMDEEEKEAEKE